MNMEFGIEKTENRDEGTPGAPSPQPAPRLNFLGLVAGLNAVLRVRYNGEILMRDCVLALGIIHAYNVENDDLCTKTIVNSQFGTSSLNGKIIPSLEKNGLVTRPAHNRYLLTVNGELLLRSIYTDLAQILNSKPIKRRRKPASPGNPKPHPWNKKGMHIKRPMAPIETFNALVEEVLSKKGLNLKVKYSLLRALGMDRKACNEALKMIEKGKAGNRIKPVLKDILSDLANSDGKNPNI